MAEIESSKRCANNDFRDPLYWEWRERALYGRIVNAMIEEKWNPRLEDLQTHKNNLIADGREVPIDIERRISALEGRQKRGAPLRKISVSRFSRMHRAVGEFYSQRNALKAERRKVRGQTTDRNLEAAKDTPTEVSLAAAGKEYGVSAGTLRRWMLELQPKIDPDFDD